MKGILAELDEVRDQVAEALYAGRVDDASNPMAYVKARVTLEVRLEFIDQRLRWVMTLIGGEQYAVQYMDRLHEQALAENLQHEPAQVTPPDLDREAALVPAEGVA